MGLTSLIAGFIAVGVGLWLIDSYVSIEPHAKQLLNTVVIIAVILWLFNTLGIVNLLFGIMSVLSKKSILLIAVFTLVGLLLWLAGFLPMDPRIRHVLNVIVIVAMMLWMLNVFGLLGEAQRSQGYRTHLEVHEARLWF